MRAVLAVLALAAAAAWIGAAGNPSRGTPLWPGARFTVEQRDRAVQRGLNFIYFSIARNPKDFPEWGHDLLSAFYNIAETSANPELRRVARSMGYERALEWRRLHPAVPANVDSDDICDLVYGHDAATRLGVPDPRMQTMLEQAAVRFTPYDYLWFDPAREPPPADVPELCKCGHQNERGATVCTRCGAKLTMRNRYELFQDALIGTYTGDRAGIALGGHYRDVLRWLPSFRPYPPPTARYSDYCAGVYAITHVVYTYNDYSQFRISPDCFPQEFEHLKTHLRQAEADRDPETMGEYLDTLRAFGLTLNDGIIRAGFDYLLASQNPDGSWGDRKDPNPYGRYHPTWTAIDGIRDYRWTRVLPCPAF
jgi:hypothetical protein